MKVWRRLKLYQRLFTVSLALNCVLLVTAFGLGTQYWQARRLWNHQAQQALDRKSSILAADRVLEELAAPQPQRKKLKMIVELSQSFAATPELYRQLELDRLEDLSASKEAVHTLRKSLKHHEREIDVSLEKSYRSMLASTENLLWIFAAGLCFGLAVPFLVLFLIRKNLKKARFQMESFLGRHLSNWLQEYRASSGNPKVDLWFKFILLVVGDLSRASSHPLSPYIRELTEALHRELERPREQRPAA